MKQPASRMSWQDVFWSTVVITVGWTLAGLAFFVLVLSEESFILALLPLLLAGLAIGAAQWLVTTRRFSASAWWILAPTALAGRRASGPGFILDSSCRTYW